MTPDVPQTRLPVRYGLAGLFAGALIAYPLAPRPSAWQALVMTVAAFVAGVVIAIRAGATADPGPWRVQAAGMLLFGVADALWWRNNLSADPKALSLADVVYVTAYALFITAAAWFGIRRSRGNLAITVVGGVGAAALSWIFLVEPAARSEDVSWLLRAVTIFYPAADLAVFVLSLRMILSHQRPAFALALCGGFLAQVATDAMYGLGLVDGTYTPGGLQDLGWTLMPALAACAAISKSATVPYRISPDTTSELSTRRGRTVIAVATTVLIVGGAITIGSLRATASRETREVIDITIARGRLSEVEAQLAHIQGSQSIPDDALRSFSASVDALAASFRDYKRRAGEAFPPPAYRSFAAAAEGIEAAFRVRRAPEADLLAAYHASFDDLARILERHVALDRAEANGASRAADLGGIVLLIIGIAVVTSMYRALRRAERARIEASLEASERFARTVLDGAADAFVSVDEHDIVREWNPAAARLFGLSRDDIIDRPLPEWIRVFDTTLDLGVVEQTLVDANGRTFMSEIVAWTAARDGGPSRNALARDVTERSRLQEQLRHQAFHDPLTGLANRALLTDRLEHALYRRAEDPRRLVALAFMDLNAFKALNDTLGHEVGDELLVKVGEILRNVMRSSDTVARTGGDEFAILVDGSDLGGINAMCDRLDRALERSIRVGSRIVPVRGSIGIALAETGDDARTLMQHADIAMFAAKQRGGDRPEVWTASLHSHIIARHRIEAELSGLVDRNELFLEYQPILDLASRRVVGSEALVRWQHPDRGRIPPLEFIKIAEDSGSIAEIGAWVLETACRQTAHWNASIPSSGPLHIAVNLSVRQLTNPTVAAAVKDIIAASELAPHLVTLEVTESAVMDDPDRVIEALRRLRSVGVQIALDDFGTGYSSLSYLRRLPIDVIKIDQSFVAGIAEQDEQWALASAVVRLAGTLDKLTLAEGIETAAQLAHIRTLGCNMAQGYYFSRPLAADAFAEFVGLGPSAQTAG